jgi:autotransporter-associated beta strand protein
MKTSVPLSSSISLGVPSRRPGLTLPSLFVTVAMLLLLLSTARSTFAGSATWKTSPATGDWNHAANWTPPTIPNGPSDMATFAFSNTTSVSLSADTEVNGIMFNAGASAFTITMGSAGADVILTLSGLGIMNNSGIEQHFVVDSPGYRGLLRFTNSSTAGSLTTFTNNSYIDFFDTSTAGDGTFIINGGILQGGSGGRTEFSASSTAGNATFTINGGTATDSFGGLLVFLDHATAGHATIIANGSVASGAGGGRIFFDQHSRGGTARMAVFGNAYIFIAAHRTPGLTIGSIEGSGAVLLGANNLTVGSNNLSTTFSGVIGGSGMLTKIGRGKLVLKHGNTYSGGTTVEHGKLFVNNRGASGTGTGPVQVNGGMLGGKGIIAGAVTVGTGSGQGATLSPGYLHGVGSPGALTIQSALTFNADAIYKVDVNSDTATADEVIANGVTINGGAQFAFADIGSATLPIGTVFTVINNTSATPIAGTFSNLPTGSMFTANGNTYQVNYEGGDGNDLTLTVVP